MTNPKIAPWQAVFRTIDESGYTAKDQAVRTLDRLRSIISEVDWTAISGGLNLTMSAGICTVRQTDSVDDILTRADAALYRAKDAGRNRVVAA
jgi:diguanylate cyclase (GGDEF)-like protein